MLVEVRGKMEGGFSDTLEKIKEELAVHHAGLHVSSKGQRSAWLRYRVMPDGDAVDAARAPQRILWVK